MIRSNNHQPTRSGSAPVSRRRNPAALAALLLAGALLTIWLASPVGAQSQSVIDTKTLNAPTLAMRTTTPRMTPGTIEGDLNWTGRDAKQCSIDSYEVHYKKSSVSTWPSTSDTADADSGVHVIQLDSQHHGADVLWVWVIVGKGSQPTLDNVQYDVRVRVDGADCTAPSAFSALAQATPMQRHTPAPSTTPQSADFDGQTLAVKHVTDDSTACLDVSYGSASNGQDVQTWDCNESDAQKWTFEKRTAGDYKDSYRLVSQVGDGTYCLDNRGDFSTSNRMGIWKCVDDTHWAAANQSVAIAASGDGYTLTFSRGNQSVWLVTDRASSNPQGGANQTTVSGAAGASAIWQLGDSPAPTQTPAPPSTKTLNAPTLAMRATTPRMTPGTIEGDLNWTGRDVKQCSIDSYEVHYKKSSVSTWPAVSDTADADSGVHVIQLDSQHHGADVLWVSVIVGKGSQPTLDNVQYDVRVRVDGADCTAPSAFSALAQATPMQTHTPSQTPVSTPQPEPEVPEPQQPSTPPSDPNDSDNNTPVAMPNFDGQTLAVKHVTDRELRLSV